MALAGACAAVAAAVTRSAVAQLLYAVLESRVWTPSMASQAVEAFGIYMHA